MGSLLRVSQGQIKVLRGLSSSFGGQGSLSFPMNLYMIIPISFLPSPKDFYFSLLLETEGEEGRENIGAREILTGYLPYTPEPQPRHVS